MAGHPKDARAAQPLSSLRWVWRCGSGDLVTADPESRLVLCLDLSSPYLPRAAPFFFPGQAATRRAPTQGGGGAGAELRANRYRPPTRAFRVGLHRFLFVV